ncbi:hypothetical protein Leryth_020644 [Lithospermum erythrorhizon]|nr:hypothetical protein Leryth_020644 [Lithospermum erythrorhizon]
MEANEEGGRGSQEKILVSVRVRPLNEKEILNNDVSDWECINDSTIFYKNSNLSVSERSMYPSAYSVDRVFGSECSTRQVYEQGAKEVALAVVGGVNSSVFAYGQTSSGKTYTMTGITGYTVEDIYEYIQKHNEREFMLKFSAMEIYNESVRDLLNVDTTPLRLLDDPERGTVVEKLIEETVRDKSHLIELLSICEAQRQIGETFLNENSSRSHQIIRLTIESSAREFLGRENFSTLTATVNFVDLAGSERASQSLSAGTRLKEGCHINRSLLTLGTVVRKLSKGRGGHVPYRDSKLTRILQPCLGGNAKTAIICTMSPARTHVEQSRNTLLFASCAKEVTTSAQVNVVMSDKVLVKHLQRELARLESEMRNPGPASVSALVREKDLQIEKLENQVKELIMQRDIAQSQLKQVLQIFRNDSDLVRQESLGHYPSLRVRKSPESVHSRAPKGESAEFDIRSCSPGHSPSSSDDQFIQIPNLKESFLHVSTPQRLVISNSNYSGSDLIQGWDELERQSNEASEDLCKEVRCIEKEYSYNKDLIASDYLSPEKRLGFSTIGVHGNEEQDSVSCVVSTDRKSESPYENKYRDFNVVSKKESEEVASPLFGKSTLTVEEKEFSCIHLVDVSSNAKSTLEKHSENHQQESGSTILAKSGRYKDILYVSSLQSEEVRKDIDSKQNLTEVERQLSPSSFSTDVKTLSVKGCHSSSNSITDIKLEVSDRNTVPDVEGGITDEELKEKLELQPDKEVTEEGGKKKDENSDTEVRYSKDVGLDPIEDGYKNLHCWPSEFRMLQKQIIELWHSCHVSLVHRTYFFLLFQGDPSDAVYMEVELRRLKYLKQTFARGEKTTVRGQTMSLEASEKILHEERRMLSKQMLKKLTVEERDTLYLKWGIGLNTKLRRLQLAHRLWTNKEDTNHINDSAYLVAKLVGFIDTDQAPKEMFTLDFAPRFTTRTYSFKRGLLSLI